MGRWLWTDTFFMEVVELLLCRTSFAVLRSIKLATFGYALLTYFHENILSSKWPNKIQRDTLRASELISVFSSPR